MGEGKKELFKNIYIAFYDAAITFKKEGRVLAENIEGVWVDRQSLKNPSKAFKAFCARSPEQAE